MLKTKKKLALRTQTVGALTPEALQVVQGGRVFRPVGSQCSYEQSGCIQEPDK